mgnify:FL=1
MKIGDLARCTGVSVRMLRFYESRGLLAPARNAAGYRLYDEKDAVQVAKIRLLQQAGLALKDIARLHDCLHDRPQAFCPALRDKLRACQMETEARITQLQETQTLLARLLDAQSELVAWKP